MVQILNGVELDADLNPSPVRVFFTEFVRVFGDALELAKKCVQLGPVDIIFSKFAMLSRENVLIPWSVLVLEGYLSYTHLIEIGKLVLAVLAVPRL